MFIDLAQIKLKPQIRDEYDPTKFRELVESIARVGQLQAVVVEDMTVNGTYTMVYGEHRYKAILQLNAEGREIPMLPAGVIRAEVRGQLTEETKMMLQFEENERRADFTWQERAKYVRRFHEMFKARRESWTEELTGLALGISSGMINYLLNLDKAIIAHPEVAKAETLSAAVKRMKTANKLEYKKHAIIRDSAAGMNKALQVLTKGDSRVWIKTVPNESIDLVNFDPPWGDEASRKVSENWDSFDDSTEYSDTLMSQLFPEIYRVLKPDSFCLFWFRAWAQERMRALALSFCAECGHQHTAGEPCRIITDARLKQECGCKDEKKHFNTTFTRTPCIWYKPDKVSDQNRFPEKQPIESYEMFFILRKGDPVFNERNFQNLFVEARTPRADQIHPTEKPLTLMERLVKILTVPGASVLDPCAGSCAVLHAAYKVMRKPFGCELDQDSYDKALIRMTEAMK